MIIVNVSFDGTYGTTLRGEVNISLTGIYSSRRVVDVYEGTWKGRRVNVLNKHIANVDVYEDTN